MNKFSDHTLAALAALLIGASNTNLHAAAFSDDNWSSMGGLPGTDGAVYAAAVDGSGNLYIGGNFTIVGDVLANWIAKWDGTNWSTLSSGMNGPVQALAISGNDLYAGGAFTTAGGSPANYIARWDGTNWSALGSGMNTNVLALAVSGSDLYAGGNFTTAGGSETRYVARWNGSSWSALGSGMNGSVSALAILGTDLYAGGGFTTAGESPAEYIAKWNGSDWSALGSGMDKAVAALAVSGSDLYAGGSFYTAGGNAAPGVARWDGSSWSALGSGMVPVSALAIWGTDLYAGVVGGGEWRNAKIAKWDGSSWSLIAMMGEGTLVSALVVSGTNLYAGGAFGDVGGTVTGGIARWNGSSWSALGTGMNSFVSVLAISGSDLYAGGYFTTTEGGSSGAGVAKWNGTNWSALGLGITNLNPDIYAIAASGTNVYAGGWFGVVTWNGTDWPLLGSEQNLAVKALAFYGSDLYAAGYPARLPGLSIARWDGSRWSSSGLGTNWNWMGHLASVEALAVSGSNLYAGGFFTIAGGTPANHIAKWDGTRWSALGSGMDEPVEALAVLGGDLYAGGAFTTAGGSPANRIAKWDGTHWSALGSGMNGYVSALAVSGNDLYAGGAFTTAGGYPANRIAKWNGTCWSPLGSGMNGGVWALAISGSNLYAGGGFSTAGGKVSARVARASIDNLDSVRCPAPEIAVEQPAGVSLADGASSVDFGRALVGSSSQRTFTIRNSGIDDLADLSLTIGGANATEFTVTASPAAAVPPGGSTTFTVTFIPAAPGVRVAALHITSNDADEYAFDITLTALAPLTGFVQSARLVTTITSPTPGYPQYFGSSVAALGSDRVLIGAPGDPYGSQDKAGAAYLFSTAGTLLTTFTNPLPPTSDQFGRKVLAVGSDRVFIAAPYHDSPAASDAGVAYLFNTNGTLLNTITNPTPGSDENFGFRIAAVGSDCVLVGVPDEYDPSIGFYTGVAYLFSINGTLLTTFTNPAPVTDDSYFGEAVAALGSDRVMIAAPARVYVFSTNGTLLNTVFTASGNSLAAVGNDRVLVGVPYYNYHNSSPPYVGAAYLLGTNNTVLATFTNPTPAYFERFGLAVAAVGSGRVLIGAMDSTAAPSSGAAYLFGTGGTLLTTITNPTPATGDSFGSSLAAVGTDQVIIGAPSDDTGATNAGAAYLFSLDPLTPRLSVTHSGGSVIVSWTKAADDFVLDQSVTLGAWSEVTTATYQTNATSIFITLPAPTDNKFFRLRRPQPVKTWRTSRRPTS